VVILIKFINTFFLLIEKMVSYDLMQQQIKREITDYLKDTRKEEINASAPELSYKQGKVRIGFRIEGLPKSEFLSVVDAMNEYYRVFSEMNHPWYNAYEITAELDRDWTGKMSDKEKKANKIKVSLAFNKYFSQGESTNEIVFEKESELSQEEISCFLAVWKMYAKKNDCSSASKENIIQSLTDQGAIVYDSNKDFTWSSIAGYEPVKKEVRETIILPFKHPEIYKKISQLTRVQETSNIPRAVLFEGVPGTGKTTMARIIANESGLPLIYVPIESIMSCWYGVAEKRLAHIFDYSSQFEKSIMFLDEIDSLAGSRDKEMHEATRRILSVLLRKMQGFMSIENVMTLGATNRINDLDRALLSRFNRTINFPLPAFEERKAIFKHYAKHMDEESLATLAQQTERKSGRDIEDICGDSERMWASKLISENAEASPPSLEAYLEALKFKFCVE
jgi:SpoVK/Ycf46/Vps4 family AAA+-type ATPase